ncbi:MAG: hypothetical protein LBJ00_18400 [Planctomycetaceae bacterium]|nr:hypothetical protein [Planctomycetaceae bacterium]
MKRLFRGEAYRLTGYGISVKRLLCPSCPLCPYRPFCRLKNLSVPTHR